MRGIVHVAGPLVRGVQHCSRCDTVLSDYRNAMWPDDQPPPQGWEPGVFVAVSGNAKWVCDGEDGIPCTTGTEGES